tara:strand:+ start:2212 stop:2472 length:261 start_codon:yes stop_codon:yes gene_type:complete
MPVNIDMAKAKNIHRENIRYYREEKFKTLDIEFNKALETGASTTEIIAKKQALRDAPADSAIESAKTDEELKTQWNTDLLGSSPYS